MEMFPRYNAKPPPPPPGVMALERNPETLERELIFGMMRHYRFYIEMRDQICPRDAATGVYRRDFVTDRYNTLFQALDAYWRKFDSSLAWAAVDVPAPDKIIIAYIVDWINKKAVNMEKTNPLLAEIEEELPLARQITLDMCRTNANSVEFATWMEERIAAGMMGTLTKLQSQKKLTLAQIRELTAPSAAYAASQSKVSTGEEVMMRSRSYSPAWRTKLKDLDRALGGGIRRKEAWLVAALTGGGKTVFANQLLWAFIEQEANTVFVTTEQAPDDLIPRILSNAAEVPISQFIEQELQTDAAQNNPALERVVLNVPAWMWTADYTKNTLANVRELMRKYVRFIDWSGGDRNSIKQHLEPELQRLRANGWKPDILIFDWLGGALEQSNDPDRTRLIYKQAADDFVLLCRTQNYAGVMTMQLAQGMATDKRDIKVNTLSECKHCADRMHGFIGISGIHDRTEMESQMRKPRLQRIQFMYVDKARTGPGGSVRVVQNFALQRFEDGNSNIKNEPQL